MSITVNTFIYNQSGFGRLYTEGKLCDLTLRTVNNDGTKRDFMVHRALMASASEYWERLLTSNWPIEMDQSVIPIFEMSSSVLDLLLRCTYGLEPVMSLEQCVDVMEAADRFLMDDLRNELHTKFLLSNPSFNDNQDLFLRIVIGSLPDLADNIPRDYDLQIHLSHSPIRKRAKKDSQIYHSSNSVDPFKPIICRDRAIVKHCLHSMLKSHLFLHNQNFLLKINLEVMRLILSDNHLVMPEKELLELAIRWATYNHIPVNSITELIRYPLMSELELDLIQSDGIVKPTLLLSAYKARTFKSAINRVESTCVWPVLWMRPRMTQTVVINIDREPVSSDIELGLESLGFHAQFTANGFEWQLTLEVPVLPTDRFILSVEWLSTIPDLDRDNDNDRATTEIDPHSIAVLICCELVHPITQTSSLYSLDRDNGWCILEQEDPKMMTRQDKGGEMTGSLFLEHVVKMQLPINVGVCVREVV